MQYAGAGVRSIAALIDGVIIGVVSLVLGVVLTAAFRDIAQLLSFVFNLALSIGYWVFYQSSAGQTIGKKVMGIKVVDSAGNKPTTTTFFLREVVGKFISGIILAIGYLMILWDSKKQGLHDKIASTYVVKVAPSATPAQG